ncbi:hypothetical protein [Bradyrhizobium sp. OAE829]|uniref:hypothetical protein n=1 Tax=Bradyrhizobium sp. OAE829 TaxID=2663807 RepID=UPI00178A0E7D
MKKRKAKDRNFEITPLAISTFEKMRAIECACVPRDWAGKYWVHTQCSGCEQWWDLHSTLWDELKLRLWEWPAFEDPNATCPYPAGCCAAERWQKERYGRPEAFELYVALCKASKAERGS